MTWNLFAEITPTPADFPILFGCFLEDEKSSKMKWHEQRADTPMGCGAWHPDWTHWISITPPTPPIVESPDLVLGRKLMNEYLLGGKPGGYIDDLCAACVKAGRQEFRKSIKAVLAETSTYSKSYYSGAINYEVIVSRISKIVQENP